MEDFGMKENKSQDNQEPKGPYKHFERPTTSRSAMHHRHRSEPAPELLLDQKRTLRAQNIVSYGLV